MQNKGYQTPYGSTVIPGAHGIAAATGGNNGSTIGPADISGLIPGAIGVAGRSTLREITLPEQSAPMKIPTMAEAMGQGAIEAMLKSMGNGALDGLVTMLADRLAPRIAELVSARVMTQLSEIGTQAIAREPELEQALRSAFNIAPAPIAQPTAMVAGSANGIHELVAAGVKATATSAIGIPPEQVEAYSKAHRELEEAVAHYGMATVGEVSLGFEITRRAPEPPVFALTAKNGVRSEWSVYSAAYDQPRFRLAIPPGVLPADRYLVLFNGQKIGYVIVPQLLVEMAGWLIDNDEPIQADSQAEPSS
jgi:hypothetical protein